MRKSWVDVVVRVWFIVLIMTLVVSSIFFAVNIIYEVESEVIVECEDFGFVDLGCLGVWDY